MKLSVQILLMFAALCAVLRETAFGEDPAEPATNAVLSLDQVLREVLVSNPSLKAAHANWEAMKQRVPQARAWEDLRGGFDSVAGRFVSIPPNSFTDQKLMVEQAVPLSGKNRLRGEAAEAPKPRPSPLMENFAAASWTSSPAPSRFATASPMPTNNSRSTRTIPNCWNALSKSAARSTKWGPSRNPMSSLVKPIWPNSTRPGPIFCGKSLMRNRNSMSS